MSDVAPAKKKGGWRPGAGRPKGSIEKFGRANDLINPVLQKIFPNIPDFILAMRPKEIVLLAARLEAADGRWVSAAMLADKAAPYFDEKIQTLRVDATIKTNPTELNDDELLGLLNVVQGTVIDVE